MSHERELEKLKKEAESLEEEKKFRAWDFIKKNQGMAKNNGENPGFDPPLLQ